MNNYLIRNAKIVNKGAKPMALCWFGEESFVLSAKVSPVQIRIRRR